MVSLSTLRTFSGGLAHNFNNLLTVIGGNVALLRQELSADSAVLPMLDDIEVTVHRAENIILQMMLFARKRASRLDLLNLSSLIAEVVDCLPTTVPGVAVEYAVNPTLPMIRGDPAQVRQLTASLLSNAVEAIDDHSGTIRVITRAVHADRAFLAHTGRDQELPEGDYVYLQVADNGCGMDAQTQQHLFEPFFTTKFVGRGLGLSASLGIVRQHHGAIWVASSPGEGTTVHVLLPCA
jgi:two-component system cell cycle sensor histidine kinase/response regulator CckA